ncbi:MAG: RNA methyltransferase [Saprospirales bacterium]|nr:RNA methyltransferase [Saprospirales bacterium]
MLQSRKEKFERVAARRQGNLTIILENVHDPHNIGAVMRSCDSVGINDLYVLYTEPHLKKERLILGKRTSAGTRKWLNIHFFTEAEACFHAVRQRYETILCTHLGAESENLYDLDLTRSIALLFGNERDGISAEALRYTDGNFLIPQMGMAGSLNISVACAVTLYEAFRQRWEKGYYTDNPTTTPEEKTQILETYIKRHDDQYKAKSVKAENPRKGEEPPIGG